MSAHREPAAACRGADAIGRTHSLQQKEPGKPGSFLSLDHEPNASLTAAPHPALRATFSPRCGEKRTGDVLASSSPRGAGEEDGRCSCFFLSPRCGGRGRAMFLLLPLPALRGEDAQRAGEGAFRAMRHSARLHRQPRPSSGAARHLLPVVRGEGERRCACFSLSLSPQCGERGTGDVLASPSPRFAGRGCPKGR